MWSPKTAGYYRVRQKYLTIYNTAVCGTVGVGNLSFSALVAILKTISVAMESWSVERRAFAVETIFKNYDSVFTQKIFRRHFNIHRNECP